jgi:hypothetical protein
MSGDNQLLRDLDIEARKYYDNVTPAFAYVFEHNGQKGLRLEAPDVVLEYSNGVPLGRDPRGFLYYFQLSDLDILVDMRYKISIERRKVGDIVKEEVLVISFWAKTDDVNKQKPYAKFIAAVPTRAWGQTTADDVIGGKWAALNTLQATSLAESRGNSSLVKITVNSLSKKFEFNIPDAQTQGSAFNCHGSLIVRDDKQLTGSNIYVDYTNTRILIFKAQYDAHPIAVFSPLELPRDYPLVDRSFQVNNGVFSNI